MHIERTSDGGIDSSTTPNITTGDHPMNTNTKTDKGEEDSDWNTIDIGDDNRKK